MDTVIYVDGRGYFTRSPKTDENGNQLYLLPQEPTEVRTPITRREETVEETTEPIMIVERSVVPVLDAEGAQVSYIPTFRGEVLEDTGEPVWEQADTEDGPQEVQKLDDLGRPLFWGQVPDPRGEAARIFCTTVEEAEVQKKDSEGNLLYWKDVEDELVSYEPQEPLEITAEDERYVEGLELAYNLTPYDPPAQEVILTAEQRIARLEADQLAIKAAAKMSSEKVDGTTADLGSFMDFYFNQ